MEGKVPEGEVWRKIREDLAPDRLPKPQWTPQVRIPYTSTATGLRCEDCDVAWNTANGEEDCWSCGRQGTQ